MTQKRRKDGQVRLSSPSGVERWSPEAEFHSMRGVVFLLIIRILTPGPIAGCRCAPHSNSVEEYNKRKLHHYSTTAAIVVTPCVIIPSSDERSVDHRMESHVGTSSVDRLRRLKKENGV